MRLPLPLGGTSNHFRTALLRRVGGWDPFNVTEDSDLGIRLARFGYDVDTIVSTTYEEAPARFGPWLRQRTRWLKGWIQTYLVHMRAPRRLLRELGPAGFLAFQLLVGGTVLAALVHPLFLALVLADAASGALLAPGETSAEHLRKGLELATLAAGYLGSLLLGLVGLTRRKMRRIAFSLAAIPLYWLLLSLAAWRALVQFLFSPYKWEKTEHGLARTSWREPTRASTFPALSAAAGTAVRSPRRATRRAAKA
jgi:cellulose synthase/poly-beta-1,6-N-acetylglucosamine synthase-like glycosyltransferase